MASGVDNALFRESIAALGVNPREVILAAEDLLHQHREEVLYLARAIDELPRIGAAELSELCHRPGSPLAPYAVFYRRRK